MIDITGVPLLTEEQLRPYWGLEADDDTYSETATPTILSLVTNMFESYCRRGLAYRADITEEVFNFFRESRLILSVYPLVTVSSVTIDDVVHSGALFRLNKMDGWIEHVTDKYMLANAASVVISYSGGYTAATIPQELANAYANAVGVRIGVTVNNVALTAPGMASSSPIKSIGIGGGALSVAFDSSSSARIGGLSGAYDVSNAPVEVQPYAPVLDSYRRVFI
jgi:hypothetical protein